MNIYLVRHGQTDWEVRGKTMGHTDIPLNDVGEEQAVKMCMAFDSTCIARVFSSDLSRAIATANWISIGQGTSTILDDRLRERDFENESYNDACTRYKEVFNEIVDPQLGDIAIISHDGPIRYLISVALGIPRWEKPLNTGQFDLDNCRISHLDYTQGVWKVRSLNTIRID